MSSLKKYDVVVIENAFVDILSEEAKEKDLTALGLTKGTSIMMNGKAGTLNNYFCRHNLAVVPGGSGANVAVYAACAGANTAFLGSIGNDGYGLAVENDFRKYGVDPFLVKKTGHTGVCYALITPDAERTMVFDSETAANYTTGDVDKVLEVIKNTRYLHTSMYALLAEPQKSAVLYALDIAKKAGAKISFDFASAPLISHHNKFIRKILVKYVDIAVANGDEAEAFSGSITEAQNELESLCEASIIKLGANGSLITYEHEIYKIPAFPADVLDTTGAGDAYIGMFLAKMAQGECVEKAGIAASKKAAEVVTFVGARSNKDIPL